MRTKELDKLIEEWGAKSSIDFGNVNQMAEDVWLFLTSDKRPAEAKIKKAALIHEVAGMLEIARQHLAKAAWEECNKQHADRSGHCIPDSIFDEWISKYQQEKSSLK